MFNYPNSAHSMHSDKVRHAQVVSYYKSLTCSLVNVFKVRCHIFTHALFVSVMCRLSFWSVILVYIYVLTTDRLKTIAVT